MATSTEQAVRHALFVENKLNTSLGDQSTSNEDLLTLLDEYRTISRAAIFSDTQHASTIEDQLWSAHSKVNTRFRKQLSKLQRDGKNRAVEIRKLAKQYLEFIKSSQRFYRAHILQLDAHYGGIDELRQVANRWAQHTSQLNSANDVSEPLKHRVITSCYQTLIHLGDLSRYRETELGGRERNWGPAIGYYSLAAEIYPDSGVSHNQQAVVALADGNHLRATYHLYRSLAVKEPHPSAKDNLELEFKKVVAAWARGELISSKTPRDGSAAGKALSAWFVRLHSKCYKGEDFPELDELENEVMSQLAIELKERSIEGILQKFIVINCAAEYYASSRLQGGDRSAAVFKSYFFFLRLNIRTFFTLLQILQPELERSTGDDLPTENRERPKQLSDKITPIARRVLPGLRLYSSWLVTNAAVVAANVGDPATVIQTKEMWKAYADTLTLLASTFPAQELPSADYMLEEDADTVGFKPLSSDRTRKTWYSGEKLKPKFSDPIVERHHPNVEMLVRVRDFLTDGLQLIMDESVPLVLEGLHFVYQENGLSSEPLANGTTGHESPDTVTVDRNDIAQVVSSSVPTGNHVSHSVAPSEAASNALSKDAAMNRMVDDLVGPDHDLDPLPEDHENVPPTPPEQTFEDTTLVSESTFGPGPPMANDYVHMVKSYTQPLLSGAGHMARDVNSSPPIRNLSSLPPLPNQSAIWNVNYGSSGPSTPYLPPGLPTRGSPLNASPKAYGHSRNHSASSVRSQPYADPWNSYNVTPAAGQAQGFNQSFPQSGYRANDAFGTVRYSPYTGGHAANGASTDTSMRSALLFGTGSSGWGTPRRRSFGLTPPNGQAG